MASLVTLTLLLITISAMSFAQTKPGACPPTGQVGICANLCDGDQSCDGIRKCCPTACGGTQCSNPVSEPVDIVKPGSCPPGPTGRWTCSSTCRTDGDCRGTKKCCTNRCRAKACQYPIFILPELDDDVPPGLLRDNES